MDITQKITRDINQFKSVPSSQIPGNNPATPSADSSGWGLSSIFTPYTIGIVVVILLMFGAWFAWDWYKTQHKSPTPTPTPDTDKSSPTPIGGSTIKPITVKETSTPTSTSTSTIPPVVTTMSPLEYAKYQKDQKALETALGTSNTGGGEPLPDDAAAGVGKAGWCYIGEEQGYGVCASVQQNDKCMSGQVFSTESECRKNIK